MKLLLLSIWLGSSLSTVALAAPEEEDALEMEVETPAKGKPPASYSLPKASGADLCGKRELEIKHAGLGPKFGALFTDFRATNPAARGVCAIDVKVDESTDGKAGRPSPRPGAFTLALRGGRAVIRGFDVGGARNGLLALGARIGTGEGKLAEFSQSDAPLHSMRAAHLVIRGHSLADIKSTIQFAMWQRFDTLILRVSESVDWDALRPFRKPGDQGLFSKAELREITEFAKARGFDVIPEFKFLTHQEKFLLRLRPDLMINKGVWDPRHDEPYRIAEAVVDEARAVMQPTRVHIGHDEAHHWQDWQKGKQISEKSDKPFTGADFIGSIKRLHKMLKAKGIETWVWGDMLLVPGNYPKMRARALHGVPEIYSRLDELPKDIVIGDWQYVSPDPGYPTTKDLASKGFRVVGATWRHTKTIQSFSSMWGAHSKTGGGMIATTWWAFPAKDWKETERILRISGDAFWGRTSQ